MMHYGVLLGFCRGIFDGEGLVGWSSGDILGGFVDLFNLCVCV